MYSQHNNEESYNKRRLQEFLDMMFGEGKYSADEAMLRLPAPPLPAKHWKECNSCKLESFRVNLNSVCQGKTDDGSGDHFSIDWLQALLAWTVEGELYEESAQVRDHIIMTKGMIASGAIKINAETNYY